MNILILNYEFPPLGGGAANATFYILKEFAKNKEVNIDLITSSVDTFKVEKFSKNVNIHYLDIGKKGNLHYQSNKDLLSYSWKAYQYAQKLLKVKNIQLVHAFFGIPCGFIAMQLGLPYIVSLRGSDVPFYNKRFELLDKLAFQRLSKRIWKKAKAVIANSQGLKDLALQTNASQEIGIIYNGIDIAEFTPKVFEHISKKLTLISTGRLIERKGYQYLIEALQGFRNFHLVLIGDGNCQEMLAQKAKEHQVEVSFLGKQPHQEIANHLRKADIFVLPSLNEGMSNSLLEAMACGLAVIVTDVGGSGELVKDCGFIVEKASVKSLKEALQKYTAQPALIKEHGLQSRKVAEQMSWTNVSQEYLEVYKQVVS